MVMREMQGPIIGSTLNKIAPQLTEGQLRDVLHLVGEIDVMKDRASALVSVVPYLSPALLLEALNMIHEITDVPERVVALTEISAYLSVDRRWELLTQAHTLVAGISQPSERIRALVSIAHKWEPSEERTRLLQSVEETLLAVRDVTRWWK